MMWSLSYDPLWPLGIIVVMAGVVAGYGVVGLWLKKAGLLWRIGALLALVLAMINPAIEREQREKLSKVALVVVDRSASQSLDIRASQTETALQTLQQRLSTIAGLETRLIEAGTDTDGTVLLDTLRQALSGVSADRLAGVFIISDGQILDTPEQMETLGLGAPIHSLITGREDEQDLRLVVTNAPRFGVVGETVQVELTIEADRGRLAEQPQAVPGASMPVTITHDGTVVETMTLPIGQPQSVELDIPHGGVNLFQFQLAGGPDELTMLNNTMFLEVEGIRENLRVLLISGKPHAGERAWRNLLKSDASVDLVHFTILRPADKQDGTPINELSLITFPTQELFSEQIDEFDLIIFDRYERLGVLSNMHFFNITGYVARGGAVLVASGPEYAGINSLFHTPLGAILSAAPTAETLQRPFSPAISEAGTRHPITRDLVASQSNKNGWGRWFRLIGARPIAINKEAPHIVMTGVEERPLLLLSRYGDGRVAVILSDHIWLWARGFEGGGPYTSLLRRLAHWLMQEPELEEEHLRAKAEGNTIRIERQTMHMAVPDRDNRLVEVQGPRSEQGQRVDLKQQAPGFYQGSVTAGTPGLYRIKDDELETLVQVGPANPREFQNVLSTLDALRPITAATGGGALRLDARATSFPRILQVRGRSVFSGPNWMGLNMNTASRLVGIDKWPLLGGLIGLAVLLGGVVMVWYREGR